MLGRVSVARPARPSPPCPIEGKAVPMACVGVRVMRPSPSIVPGIDRDTFLVLDDFGGSLGLAWRETGIEDTDLGTIIRDLLDGQYSSPVRVVAFNTAEGWSGRGTCLRILRAS